jgi:hypothetical protein
LPREEIEREKEREREREKERERKRPETDDQDLVLVNEMTKDLAIIVVKQAAANQGSFLIS